MRRPGEQIHAILVVARALVFVQDAQRDRRAKRDTEFRPALDFDCVGFVSGRRDGRLAWAAACELRLDVVFGEAEAGWAVVDDGRYGAAVGFAGAV